MVSKLQEEVLRLEKELELSRIKISLPEANKVVDDGEVVLQFVSNETLKRCKSSNRLREKRRKVGFRMISLLQRKSSNSNKEENIITANGDSSNTEVDIENKMTPCYYTH